MALVGIYDSDGGFVGEMRYAFNKLGGRSQCSLCQITHGWNPFGKKSWKEALDCSAVEISLIHRNEADATQLAATSGLPSLLMGPGSPEGPPENSNGEWVEVMSGAELATFETSPAELLERLETIGG